MTRHRHQIAAFLTLNAGLFLAAGANAGSWQNNAPFGASLTGDLYTPTTPAESPAILVALHYCTGSAANAHGWFDSYADQHGFYVIAPDAGQNSCFESSASRGGDRAAIVDMVQWVVDNKGGNPDRVFAAGFSSGGCMTNVLLTVYPDVFKGGAAMPGFPGGGWPVGDTTCTKCGSSPPSTDGAYWGDLVRDAFPWDGQYPCSQQWSGGADEYNFHAWLPAIVAQYQNLSGLDGGSPGTGAPNGWNRTDYKDANGNVRLQTNILPGQKHDLTGSNLPGHVVSFLGLDKPTGACGIEAATPDDTGSTQGGDGSTDVSVSEPTDGAEPDRSTGGAPTTSAEPTTTEPTSNTNTPAPTGSTSEPATTTSTGGVTSAPNNPSPTPPAPTAAPSATSTDSTAPANPTAAPPASNDNSGSSCSVASRGEQKSLAALLFACFGLLLAGRRSRR